MREPKLIFVLGATSAIAKAVMISYCEKGGLSNAQTLHFALVARDQVNLEIFAQQLRALGASAATRVADLATLTESKDLTDWAIKTLGGLDLVLLAYGDPGNHQKAIQSTDGVVALINTNFASATTHLTAIANYMEGKASGIICALSSVSGDRGRQSNYIYGSSKAALTIFLSGLRSRLDSSGVRVVTIKHGFVDTPMNKNLKKNFIWATPKSVAPTIIEAIATKNRDVYIPAFWWLIMRIIRSIPERFFVRLKL